MKTLSLLALLAFASADAFAYSSNTGADPINESPDVEAKVVVKSAASGVSHAVSKGHILSYSAAADGYTVTRIGENSVRGTNQIACIADRDIATANSGSVRRANCLTKGFVNFLRYDATTAITAGAKLCSNTTGVAVVCAACDSLGGANDCKFGSATANSGIISLESKASGTGSDLKAIVNLK
jgi:hypothetical protein